MSYKKLEVWEEARDIVIDIHKMSLTLPRFGVYEMGGQIRRSSKSIKANIVEGYGRRRCKNDFIKFIVYALASTDETIDHLETLIDTKSLNNSIDVQHLMFRLIVLNKKLIRFLDAIGIKHISSK